MFREPVVEEKLREENTIYAGFWDMFVSIYVTAGRELEISVDRRLSRLFIWLLLVAFLLTLSAVVFFLVGRGSVA